MTIIKRDGNKNRLIVEQLGYDTGDSPTEGIASVALSSDANYTLLNTQYNAQIIILTSPNISLTETRDIIVPLNNGSDWMFRNNTTGNQSVIIKGASGTGVTIPNGESVHVFTDGTNVYTVGSSGGAQGPQGYQGATGATGPQGTQGTSGIAGTNINRQIISSYADTYVTTWTTVGSLQIIWTAPATYSSWIFSATLSATTGYSVQARLFDLTNNSAVSDSVISTSSTSATYVSSNSITIPNANSTRLYLVQISIVSGSPSSSERGVILASYSDLS